MALPNTSSIVVQDSTQTLPSTLSFRQLAQPQQLNARSLLDRGMDRRKENLRRPLPTTFVMESLRKKALASQLHFELKFHIPFVILFVFMFYASRHVDEEYFSSGLAYDLFADHAIPPLNPVTNASGNPLYNWNYFNMGQEMPDSYDVIDNIVIPQLFNFNDAGTPVAAGDIRMYRGQLALLGSVRFRSKHVRAHTCSGPADAYGIGYPADFCFAKLSDAAENTGVLNPLGPSYGPPYNYSTQGCEQSFSSLEGFLHTYSCGGFVIDIPFSSSFADAQAVTSVLRTNRFLYAPSLRFFEIRCFAYHISTKAYLSIHLAIEVEPSGGWYQQAIMSPFIVSRDQSQWILLVALVMAFVAFFLGRFFWSWQRDFLHTGNLLHFLLDIWNLLDLVNYCVFIAFFVFYFLWWKASHDFSRDYPDIGAITGYPSKLADLQYLFQMSLKVNALNFLLVFLKTLKYLRLNDRINVLTRTLERAARTIMTIIAVFSVVVLAYALAGNTLYGVQLFAFRKVSVAWSSLFRLLIGDFDYDAMRSTNHAVTFVFFWSFVILGLFIFLNMIVAVIMDCFEAERKTTEDLADAFIRHAEDVLAWLEVRGVALWSATTQGPRSLLSTIGSSLVSYVLDIFRSSDEVKVLRRMEKWYEAELKTLENTNKSLSTSQLEKELNFRKIDFDTFEEIMANAQLSDDHAVKDVWADTADENVRTSYNEDTARLDEVQTRVSRCTASAVAEVIGKDEARRKVLSKVKIQSVTHFMEEMKETLDSLTQRVNAYAADQPNSP